MTVIKRGENNKYGQSRWWCKCDCGNLNLILIQSNNLQNGHTKSCGCYNNEIKSKVHRKYNTYDLTGEYGIGYTFKGKLFYFDLEDYDKIKNYCWNINKDGYVCTFIDNNNILMHRLIMNVINEDITVDHIFHNNNDNRKNKLRIASYSNNLMNGIKRKNNTSGTVGVVWNKKNNKWVSQIMLNGKNIYLGSYTNKENAIKSRKQAEDKYFGEYSYSNSMLENNIG